MRLFYAIYIIFYISIISYSILWLELIYLSDYEYFLNRQKNVLSEILNSYKILSLGIEFSFNENPISADSIIITI